MQKLRRVNHYIMCYIPFLSLLFSIALNHVHADALTPTPASRYYTLATATPGSTNYPVGVAIATLTRVRLEPQHGVALLAMSSAGSGENLALLKANQAQAAILQSLYGAQQPLPQLRAITALWLNVEHFMVYHQQVRTGTIVDLKGFAKSRFSLGLPQSGAEGSGRYILKQLGIDADESLSPVYLDYQMSAEALLEGKIAGMNIPNGVPSRPVQKAFEQLGAKVALLSFTDEQLRQINRHHPLWQRYTLAANTYSTQVESVATIAQPNFLAVDAALPADDVYWITRTVYENIEFLTHIHPAAASLSLETALDHLPIPLHPGALRYYQTMGVTIPDELRPPPPTAGDATPLPTTAIITEHSEPPSVDHD